MKIEYKPIGIVHSPFKEAEGTPIQPTRAKRVQGTVEVYTDYEEGLADLDGFSHIILLFHFHKSKGFKLKVIPFLDTVHRGLFSTRAPKRPNSIGLSVVKLLKVEGNILTIEGVDMLDGTPILDIKPHVGEFEDNETLRIGWVESARQNRTVSDNRFEGS